ncbi:ABC transporter permease, partial [Klebsiella sp. K47]
ANSVGKSVRLNGNTMTVVGVLGDWHPNPHFYDLYTGRYGDSEDVYLPLSTAIELKFDRNGSIDCFGRRNETDPTGPNASC